MLARRRCPAPVRPSLLPRAMDTLLDELEHGRRISVAGDACIVRLQDRADALQSQ